MACEIKAVEVSRWCPIYENFRRRIARRLAHRILARAAETFRVRFPPRGSSAAEAPSSASDIRRGKGTADVSGEPPTGFSRAWRRSRVARSRRFSSRPARARGAACFHHNPHFAAVQGRTLDPTLLPRLRNRRQVTRHSKIDHGVRSPWSIGSRSRWPSSRSGFGK